MNLVPKLPSHAVPTIHAFLRHHVATSGGHGVVLGLSGGVDSAVAARLAAEALGPDRVTGVLLPDRLYASALLEETRAFGADLRIGVEVHPIDPVEAALREVFPSVDDATTWGNAKARIRMIALYTVARTQGRLVLGTGNKSELLLGYFTKYGDGGVDLLPLGDLYKTEVWALAERLGIPEAVRTRAPTAGLWEGQTDEAELGLPYSSIDRILRGLEELRDPLDIAQLTGIAIEQVERIERRVSANRHKRRLPPVPKLSLRTVGIDWRD